MSNFITFDNSTYFNVDKISTIEIIEQFKRLEKDQGEFAEYLSYIIKIDNEIVFESLDYKINEAGYDTPNGHKNYNDSINKMRDLLISK